MPRRVTRGVAVKRIAALIERQLKEGVRDKERPMIVPVQLFRDNPPTWPLLIEAFFALGILKED